MSEIVSFAIPCYRSENTIKSVVDELVGEIRKLGIEEYEIVLVNDCSPDGVWSVIQELCENNNRIRGVNLSRNFGQHAALLAGYSIARGDIIVSLDDDGQTPVDEINLLLDKIHEGYDAVYGYYEEMKQNNLRKIGSWLAGKMGQIMIGFPKDFKGGPFFAVRSYVVKEMIKYDNPYPYLGGLVYRTTHKITCVPAHQRNRMSGTSGYSLPSLFKLWFNGFTAFSVRPIRWGAMIGILLAFVGFIAVIVLGIRKLVNPAVVLGWTSIFSAILMVGGLILTMLGLVGEYVGRIYLSINNSPQYVIRDVIGSESNVERCHTAG